MTNRSWVFLLAVGCLAVACAPHPNDPSDGSTSNDATGPDGSDATATDVPVGSDVPVGTDASGPGPQLPVGTLLYIRGIDSDHDVLVARDLAAGTERVITDLTGDGSSGWEIDSFALSPDRRRIALSSLYGPTSADTATGLATDRIWTVDTDGTDFLRLTPTFPADNQGRSNFSYRVADPEWTADGSAVLYDFGSYWWEGSMLQGGSFPWIVAANAASPPTSFSTAASCSVIYPSRNPVTGDYLFIHSVCVPGQGENGIYLYPAAGGAARTEYIASSRAADGIDVYLTKPAWFSDGSGFLFVAGTSQTDWRPSILGYDIGSQMVSMLVPAPAAAHIDGVTLSPDATKLVYCLWADDDTRNLHLIDLSAATPVDVAITNDGRSCDPSF